jgi:hypothetical protein
MYVAIVSWTDDNKLSKYHNFDVEADANAHVAKYGGFVVENPSGSQNYWIINSTNKTVTFDKDQSDKDEATLIATAYVQKRVDAYPDIGDQLDALWKGGDDQAAMKVIINKVKSDYPK